MKAAAEECIKEGILKEYLENNASEVINMLTQEWDWNKALEITARDAARDAVRDAAQATEKRVRAEMEAVVASKDAAIAGKDAEIARLKSELMKKQ